VGARRARSCDGRGMVTAELAVTTLSAFTLLVMLCWGISLVILQLRCIDTAAAVARQAARGDEAAVAHARSQAPAGAKVTVQTGRSLVTVTVRVTARPVADWMLAVPLQARAQVVPEPDSTGPP
jgi:hypothetical protein